MLVRTILADKGGDVVVISPESTVDQAISLLAQKKIGAVVVTRGDGRIAGILSERDIVRML
ncbi:MAG: CBS domain-containing protein, partial [Alphaproteobacteria bacterium]